MGKRDFCDYCCDTNINCDRFADRIRGEWGTVVQLECYCSFHKYCLSLLVEEQPDGYKKCPECLSNVFKLQADGSLRVNDDFDDDGYRVNDKVPEKIRYAENYLDEDDELVLTDNEDNDEDDEEEDNEETDMDTDSDYEDSVHDSDKDFIDDSALQSDSE